MSASRVSVIIVNWNGGDHLARCLASLREYGGESIDRIIVVDNGSTDDSLAAANDSPGVTVIQTGENLGFGRACNLGSRQVSAEFILFLNPDAAITTGVIGRALTFMTEASSSDVGICGVQLLEESGHIARSCARFPTPGGLCITALGLGRVFRGSGMLMEDWPHDESRDVDHVIGAFYLVRRGLFERLEGFDERFFMYLEDLDFSLRARLLGWRSHYLADVSAFHAGGGTSRQVKDRRLFYSLRSRILYASKHFGGFSAGMVFLLTVAVEPIVRVGWATASFSWSAVGQTVSAYRMLFRWIFERKNK